MSVLTASSPPPDKLAQTHPRSHRHKLRSLAYAKSEPGNGGILRDISDGGIALQLLSQLPPNQTVHLQLDLPSPRLHFEADGRVVWSDSLGQAGIVFLNLASRSHRLLKEWLFTQILADAHRIAGDHTSELLFSSTSRPAICLDPNLVPSGFRSLKLESIRLLWFDVSALFFSRFVDGTALLCAVLLFSLMVWFLTDVLPSWPITLAFLMGAGVVFATVYWAVFAIWFGSTPGTRLAELAGGELRSGRCLVDAHVARFR